MARQEDVSVQLAVKVVGPEPTAVGHWNTTVATAGVHRGTHLTTWSITFHTGTHVEYGGLVLVSLFPVGMQCFMFEQEACDR